MTTSILAIMIVVLVAFVALVLALGVEKRSDNHKEEIIAFSVLILGAYAAVVWAVA